MDNIDTITENYFSDRVNAYSSADGKSLTIEVIGPFDLSAHRAFRDAYESQEGLFPQYIIDFKSCDKIDSAGLGMLLMLRDFSGLQRSCLTVVNGSDEVLRVLHLASFDQLFSILD